MTFPHTPQPGPRPGPPGGFRPAPQPPHSRPPQSQPREAQSSEAQSSEAQSWEAQPSQAATDVEPGERRLVETTGHPAVDAALRSLANASQLAPGEQIAAYEAAHQVLQETLSSIEG
jgi:hypothetical protein